jgi:hypothetical protein
MPWNSKQPDLKNNPAYLEPRVTANETSLAENWYSNITNVQSNNATYGIEIDCTAGAVNGVKFTNCYSNYHSQNALYMHGASGSRAVSFDGCTFEHSTSYGINMIDHMDGTVFNGCYIENNDLGDSVPRQAYISLGYAGSDGGINFIGGQVSNVSNGIGIDFEQGNALTMVGTHFSWNGQGARPTNQVKSLAGFTSILSPSVDGYANGGSQNDFNVSGNSSIVQGNGLTFLNNVQTNGFMINTSFQLNSLKVTSSYDMTVSGIVPVLLCDATSGILNVNNFRASLCKYARFIVKKIDASTNPVIVKESFNGNKIDNTQFYYLKNQYDWVEYVSDGTQFYKVASGVAETTTTFNGDGAMTSKTLPHGLNNIPSRFSVYSNSVDAGNAGIKYVTADVNNITVFFNTPPITGTNNVSLRWRAEI